MLTTQDLLKIEKLIDERLDERLEEKFKEQFRLLPSKDEFFTAMDKLMGEIKDMREDRTIITGKVYDHEDRIEKLEEIHPDFKHVTA